VAHFSLVMFLTMTLLALPIVGMTTERPWDWLAPYASPAALGLMAILVLPCTIGGYMLMNRWQRHVTATQAGLIYCLEPVFTSAFALFLPAWFSDWASVGYANETLTRNLLLGGALITLANVLIQLPPVLVTREASVRATTGP
jgi:drug/metabolite transporter (DMT)-like permease